MKKRRLVDGLYASIKNMELEASGFLKDLVEMQEHYTKHAEMQEAVAKKAEEGSQISKDMMTAAAYNRGKADAIGEVIRMIGGDSK